MKRNEKTKTYLHLTQILRIVLESEFQRNVLKHHGILDKISYVTESLAQDDSDLQNSHGLGENPEIATLRTRYRYLPI